MEPKTQGSKRGVAGVDAQVGKTLFAVKFGTDALRTVRTSIMEVAYALAKRPDFRGFLVLVDSTISEDRVHAEWQSAQYILKPTVMDRITVCIGGQGNYRGYPNDPNPEMQQVLADVVRKQRLLATPGLARSDYSYIVLKLLLHQWFTNGEPVTADWLARTAGCSYPTVARALSGLGSVLVRKSDRRVSLRYFPHEEFSRLLANSSKVRSTIRFADYSGLPRSPEVHLRRLESLNPPNVALGGVFGARHYYPDLDIVGAPRLDISVHCSDEHLNHSLIEKLDPALKPQVDPLKTANVVVHIVRDANPLFESREGSLRWADPVECLLDLYEARLKDQATQFLNVLQRNRQSSR